MLSMVFSFWCVLCVVSFRLGTMLVYRFSSILSTLFSCTFVS
nr:MAG TPA: hypothetical protein [Bacteriophage sp.]